MTGFMHQYYDWTAFEEFVKGLYEEEGDVTVERDVTEKDRYGAKRQTDIKIIRRTRFHTFVTLVECKRWKERVGRDRIDVLAASIEALGAHNGAIFTTSGFKKGAVAYAKNKGIELFVVRDLTAEEWGLPGRHIQLYLQISSGEMTNLQFDAQAISLIDAPLDRLDLDVRLSETLVRDSTYDLYSVKSGAVGCNLVGILGDAHGMLLNDLARSVGLMDDGAETSLDILATCELDFSRTDFKQLRLPEAAVRFERIGFVFRARLDQSTIEIDRGKDLDFAVMVESRVSDLRLSAHRRTGDVGVVFAQAAAPKPPKEGLERPVENGSLMQVRCAPWVAIAPTPPLKQGVTNQRIRIVVEEVGATPKLSLVAEPPGI